VEVNTVYTLQVFDGTIGTMAFAHGGTTANVAIGKADTSKGLINKITAALESLPGVGSGNVTVTGSRFSAFRIEFVGALAGQDISGLTVTTAAPAPTVTVEQLVDPDPGVNEVKQISIEIQRAKPPPVDTNVSVSTPAEPAADEYKKLVFYNPYSDRGTFDLTIGGVTATVTYLGSDTAANEANIAAGIAQILGVGVENLDVTFDAESVDSHVYDIFFVGELEEQNIGDMSISNTAIDMHLYIVWHGGEATPSEQTVNIAAAEDGVFRITVSYEGELYTTAPIPFDADAETMELALEQALAELDAEHTGDRIASAAPRIRSDSLNID